jgi:histidyl-tRNA synthetase
MDRAMWGEMYKVLTKTFMISEYKGVGISADFETLFLILRVHLTVGVAS